METWQIVGIVLGVIFSITLGIFVSLFSRREGGGMSLPQTLPNGLWLTLEWGFLIFIAWLAIGQWWQNKVVSVLGLALIVGFTLYGYGTKEGEPFRYKLAKIGIWILVGVTLWHLFLGPEYKPRVYAVADKYEQKVADWLDDLGSLAPPSTNHQATTTPTAPPREYIVTAPVGRWSERIPIVIGTIIRPEMGKPILIRDDRGIIHKDSADGSMKDPFTSSFVEVQSSNREPVTVTVSR